MIVELDKRWLGSILWYHGSLVFGEWRFIGGRDASPVMSLCLKDVLRIGTITENVIVTPL